MSVREPLLHPVPLADLRPTQITVGMREVEEKRQRWREHKGKKKSEYLGRHMIPVILGPKERHYVIDHHHLTRALLEEGERHVLVNMVADLRMLEREAFWVVVDHRGWVHPYERRAAELRRDPEIDRRSHRRPVPQPCW